MLDDRDLLAGAEAMYETWRREDEAGHSSGPWAMANSAVRLKWMQIAIAGCMAMMARGNRGHGQT